MSIFKLLLFVHIVCGSVSLLLGGYVVATKKGGKLHRICGNIYFICMLIAAIMSLGLSYLHPNYFLFIVGVFTAFMLLSGRRYIRKKYISDVKWFDWLLMWTMLLFSSGFFGFGGYNLVRGNDFGIVFLAFGAISLLFVAQDYRNFTGRSKIVNCWLVTHLQRMIGSYIASLTAFLVVNNTLLPSTMAWLLPTAVMVPLIIFWSRKNRVVNNS